MVLTFPKEKPQMRCTISLCPHVLLPSGVRVGWLSVEGGRADLTKTQMWPRLPGGCQVAGGEFALGTGLPRKAKEGGGQLKLPAVPSLSSHSSSSCGDTANESHGTP